ncbi:glycoside hydrolase family 18 protein [Annulohypoxylon stygium]|nr:glycoside hydrolase family 18 protein [Annulohypoxylon stygium]
MRMVSLWGLAQCLLWGSVVGIGKREDCNPVFLTTTIFATRTIYTTAAPNGTAPTCPGAPPFGNTTTIPIPTTTSVSRNTTTGTTTTSTSSPSFVNTTTSATSPTSIPVGNTTTSAPSIPTTSFGNTTTSSASVTSPPFVNTTTSATSAPGTTSVSSPPFGNTTTSVTLPPTTISTISLNITSTTSISSTASSTTSQPAEPTEPIPPLRPPGPFRGFKNAVYFTNWGVNSGFHPQELPVSELTHILYAFADIDLDGTVKSSDPVVDLQKRYPEDSKSNRTKNAYGVIKQLYIHKKYNRNLKTLLSIGGWNYSPKFAAVAATDATRFTFATSAVKLVTDWGFDGIDIDWEYPTDDVEKANFVKLLEACRHAFDRYTLLHELRHRFTISVASPASPTNYEKLDLTGMNKYVDIWNLMAYDYSGSWDTVSGHQANVFEYKNDPNAKKLSTDDAIDHYISRGIHPRKILMGMPLYGRSFEGTSGLGQNYSSVGEGGPQPGVWYYKDLPKPGAKVVWDHVAKATYSYDAENKELISYDDIRSTDFKSEYIQWRDLGGAFFWEASGDRGGSRSLINTMSKNLDWPDETRNNLYYPTSQYRNIRRGMPDE